MGLLKLNNKSLLIAFLLNALFGGLVLGIIFIYYEKSEQYLSHLYETDNLTIYTKAFTHTAIAFIITFFIAYLFRFIFGWGDHLLT